MLPQSFIDSPFATRAEWEAFLKLSPDDQKGALRDAHQRAMMAASTPTDGGDAVPISAWNGTWQLESRVGYDQILRYNGLPDEKLKQASEAEDVWAYEFAHDGSSFHMDHQIPATGFHLNFEAMIDGQWTDACPYQKTGTTASRWRDADKSKSTNEVTASDAGRPQGWRNTWDPAPGAPADAKTRFRTELRNADGSTLRFHRHLVSPTKITAEIFIVRADKEGGAETVLAGPALCHFTKRDLTPPRPCAEVHEQKAVQLQRKFFASGATRSVEWRCEQIRTLCGAIISAADRISEAQQADGVVPWHFAGSAGAILFAPTLTLLSCPPPHPRLGMRPHCTHNAGWRQVCLRARCTTTWPWCPSGRRPSH